MRQDTLGRSNPRQLQERISELEAENEELRDRLDSIQSIAADDDDDEDDDEE